MGTHQGVIDFLIPAEFCSVVATDPWGVSAQAITAGKRVRAETSISSGAVSVSSAAAELCQMKLPSHNFADARVAIVGAGKMSTLLVKHLLSKVRY